jgi:PadR family transcriptional regulator, regulatory protein PadR
MPRRKDCPRRELSAETPCGPRRRWGRRMRILEPMLLLLLCREPLHGYLLLERLSEEFGVDELPPQTVYRALQEMEQQAWVTGDWDLDGGQGPPRRVYSLTTDGRAALEAWSHEIEALRGMLNSFQEQYRSTVSQHTEEVEQR